MEPWKQEVGSVAWEESVSTGWLSKPTMNAAKQQTSDGNYRSTAIIESLHEINESTNICDIGIFPRLRGALSSA